MLTLTVSLGSCLSAVRDFSSVFPVQTEFHLPSGGGGEEAAGYQIRSVLGFLVECVEGASVKREERLAIRQTGTLQISLVFSHFLSPQAMTLLLGRRCT